MLRFLQASVLLRPASLFRNNDRIFNEYMNASDQKH